MMVMVMMVADFDLLSLGHLALAASLRADVRPRRAEVLILGACCLDDLDFALARFLVLARRVIVDRRLLLIVQITMLEGVDMRDA